VKDPMHIMDFEVRIAHPLHTPPPTQKKIKCPTVNTYLSSTPEGNICSQLKVVHFTVNFISSTCSGIVVKLMA
jgi:hypothetical protein